jgi:hypothetical protein
MLLDLNSFSVPVRILNEPDLFTRALPFLTTALGFALGLLAEPIKAYVMEVFAARKVKPLLYGELATVLVDIEQASERNNAWFFQGLLQKPPGFPVMAWYSDHHLNLVLRADPGGGLVGIQQELIGLCTMASRSLGEKAASDDWESAARVIELAWPELLKALEKTGDLDVGLLEKRRSAQREVRERRRKALDEQSPGGNTPS